MDLARAAGHKHRVRQHYAQWAPTYGTQRSGLRWSRRVRAAEAAAVRTLLCVRGGESILDAGCGTGVHSVPLCTAGHEVWGVDFTPEMIARVEGRVTRAVVGDVESLSLARKFDRILCIGVLDFVTAPAAVFQRLAAHLAPHGILVVLTSRAGVGGYAYWSLKRAMGVTVRLYSPRTLRALAAAADLDCMALCRPARHNVAMAFCHAG